MKLKWYQNEDTLGQVILVGLIALYILSLGVAAVVMRLTD